MEKLSWLGSGGHVSPASHYCAFVQKFTFTQQHWLLPTLHCMPAASHAACNRSVIWLVRVNAFKARLDKFWQHQAVKFDFTADLIGTRNR